MRDFVARSVRLVLAVIFVSGFSIYPSIARDDSTYIKPSDLPPTLLPPPPAEGSDLWKAQIKGVLAAQKHLVPSDLDPIRDEQHLRLELMTEAFGPDYTPQKYPNTAKLLGRVMADTGNVVEADKSYWNTRRPYLLDHHVKLLVDPIDQSPAFPSGHACGSRVIAEVMGMLVPAHVDDFRARAEAIAQHRVEAGVHYPNDLASGRLLAMAIVGALLQNGDFKSDLAEARSEWPVQN